MMNLQVRVEGICGMTPYIFIQLIHPFPLRGTTFIHQLCNTNKTP